MRRTSSKRVVIRIDLLGSTSASVVNFWDKGWVTMYVNIVVALPYGSHLTPPAHIEMKTSRRFACCFSLSTQNPFRSKNLKFLKDGPESWKIRGGDRQLYKNLWLSFSELRRMNLVPLFLSAHPPIVTHHCFFRDWFSRSKLYDSLVS